MTMKRKRIPATGEIAEKAMWRSVVFLTISIELINTDPTQKNSLLRSYFFCRVGLLKHYYKLQINKERLKSSII